MTQFLDNLEVNTAGNGTVAGIIMQNNGNIRFRILERGDIYGYDAGGVIRLNYSSTGNYLRMGSGSFQAGATSAGYTFNGDTGIGMKRFGSGTLALSSGTGGAPVTNLVMHSAGNIAIGKAISASYTSALAPPATLTIKGEGATDATSSLIVKDSLGVNSLEANDAGTLRVRTKGTSNTGPHNWIGSDINGTETSFISPNGQIFSKRLSAGFFFIGTAAGGGNGNGLYQAGYTGTGVTRSAYTLLRSGSTSSIRMDAKTATVNGALMTLAEGSLVLSDTLANATAGAGINGITTPGQIIRAFSSAITTLTGMGGSPLITTNNGLSGTAGTGVSLLSLRHTDAGGADTVQHALNMRSNSNTTNDGDADLIWWTQRTGSEVELMSLNNKTGILDIKAPIRIPSDTVANINANFPATNYSGCTMIATDEIGGGPGHALVTSDGTEWRRSSDGAIMA